MTEQPDMPEQSAADEATAVEQIIAFARHIGRTSDASPDTSSGASPDTSPDTTPSTTPEDRAQRRGWLDADGKPTGAGLELLEALNDQGTTRTVFRGNF